MNRGVGSLADIPSHWSVTALKRLCTHSALYGANVAEAEYRRSGVRFLRTTDITEDGELSPGGVYVEEWKVPEHRLDDGDLLLSRSGTVGRSFLYNASVHPPAAYAGYLVRFVFGSALVPRYAFYFTKSHAFAMYVETQLVVSTIGNLNGQRYGLCPFPVPPVVEQQRIVDVLDETTGHIATSIAKCRELLLLLDEDRRTLVHGAVAGGLHTEVDFVPSGVPWLGGVPAHWAVRRVKAVAEIRNGGTPKTSVSSYWDGDVCWITPDDLGTLRGREIRRGKRSITEAGYAACGSTMGPAGSVVLSTRAPIGHAGILAEAACTNQGCRLLVPHGIRSKYLYYLICVLRSELASLGQGSTFTELSSLALGNVRVPVPPESEQNTIVQWIEGAIGDIDAAIAGIWREIHLLQEYRTTLISEVVTGKVDVREAAERLPEPGGKDG